LEAALGDVVERHEALRTVFPSHEGEPHQRILPPQDARPGLALLEPGADGWDGALDAAVRHTFDLERDVPVRAWLLRESEREHVLVLVVHHIAGDGWSMGPLLRDLGRAYRDRSRGAVPDWEPLE
ncbi:condensation domain-containing protein, partial [Nocardiopsis sp. LOL_012]|uniref:condensation domain-containing protein n=1 Tax=Nocardiopsis sp. LOL_012 TaxID=3345409 RepID=UPI003A8897F5